MRKIKNKFPGPAPKQAKRIIKHAQSNDVNLNRIQQITRVENIDQMIVEAARRPPKQTLTSDNAAVHVATQLTAKKHDIKKETFDLEAVYSERAIKLAHEMIKGFREGWSENSLNKREVCLNCLQLFWKEHDNQEFCSDKCRDAFDSERSKREMEERREEQERENYRAQIAQRNENGFRQFQKFLSLAKRNEYKTIGHIIKKRIPGEWKTVNAWLTASDPRHTWVNLPPKIQAIFLEPQRDFDGTRKKNTRLKCRPQRIK